MDSSNITKRVVQFFFFFFFLSLLTPFRTCSRFKIHARARAPRFHPKEKRKERKNSWLKRSKWNLVGTLLSNDARLGFFFFRNVDGKKKSIVFLSSTLQYSLIDRATVPKADRHASIIIRIYYFPLLLLLFSCFFSVFSIRFLITGDSDILFFHFFFFFRIYFY